MILKQEILSIAKTLKLLPTTVEKDYVLSWVLYGISKNTRLSEWFFKGGTCLKKCYFEKYRFSEDLDFTVLQGGLYEQSGIEKVLDEVAAFVYEESGLNLKARPIEVEENINKKVQNTYVAKLTYAGPLNLPSRNQQRVKFDITCHEQVVEGPDIRDVFHPYSDAPKVLSKMKCYSISEILAEKTRALYERQGRARDVYDLVNISQNFKKYIDPEKIQAIIQKKFAFKDLPLPSLELIMSEVDWPHFEKSWVMELEHQVPALAPAEDFYAEFISVLSGWLKGIEK